MVVFSQHYVLSIVDNNIYELLGAFNIYFL